MSTAVCHVITNLDFGGAQAMLAKLLSYRDHSPDFASVLSLMTPGPIAPPIERAGIAIDSLDMPRGKPSIGMAMKLRRRIGKARPRLLQGWMYHGNLAASLAAFARFPRLPVVWNVRHSIDDIAQEERSTRAILRISAPLSHGTCAIIYNAEASAAQHEALGFSAARRVVIPNGFDCDHFKPDAEAKARFRDAHGLDGGDRLIGVVARDHPMKDIGGMLEAFAKVVETRPDCRLVIMGSDQDEGNRRLVDKIGDLGLGGRVTLLGARTDVAPIVAAFDLLVLPSAWGEGFPNVLGEAMASGVPCVATDVGDSKRLVADTGLIVPPKDRPALAEAIGRILDLDPEAHAALGAKARQRILRDYSIQEVVRRYDQLYRDLLHEDRQSPDMVKSPARH
jgi:glycosyltransferase involved in cell wall biosynthesis